MKKKVQSALLDPPGRFTGNNFLLKGGLRSKRDIGSQESQWGVSTHLSPVDDAQHVSAICRIELERNVVDDTGELYRGKRRKNTPLINRSEHGTASYGLKSGHVVRMVYMIYKYSDLCLRRPPLAFNI